MATYKLSRYPRPLQLQDGSTVVIKPMNADDGPGLLEFFRRIPEHERFFLKDDIAMPEVVHSFIESLAMIAPCRC